MIKRTIYIIGTVCNIAFLIFMALPFVDGDEAYFVLRWFRIFIVNSYFNLSVFATGLFVIALIILCGGIILFGIIGFVLSFKQNKNKDAPTIYVVLCFFPLTILLFLWICYALYFSGPLNIGFYMFLILAIILPILISILQKIAKVVHRKIQ